MNQGLCFVQENTHGSLGSAWRRALGSMRCGFELSPQPHKFFAGLFRWQLRGDAKQGQGRPNSPRARRTTSNIDTEGVLPTSHRIFFASLHQLTGPLVPNPNHGLDMSGRFPTAPSFWTFDHSLYGNFV